MTVTFITVRVFQKPRSSHNLLEFTHNGTEKIFPPYVSVSCKTLLMREMTRLVSELTKNQQSSHLRTHSISNVEMEEPQQQTVTSRFDVLCMQSCFSARVVNGTYFSCSLPVGSNKSGQFPLTSHISKASLPTEHLMFWVFILHYSVSVKVPGDQQFLKYSNRPIWHPHTMPRSESLALVLYLHDSFALCCCNIIG